jgi:excisionase family DNA binding protein
MLNVSRPFLIGLLDAGEIEYRIVGTHRRITASSLLQYKRKDDQRRREAADELTQLTSAWARPASPVRRDARASRGRADAGCQGAPLSDLLGLNA